MFVKTQHNRAYSEMFTTVEPHLSDSRLSIPSIIRNDVQKLLKQVIPKC